MKNKIKRLIKRICIGWEASRRSREMIGKGPSYGARGNQRVKTLAATAVAATMVAASAQAGLLMDKDRDGSESSGGSFWGSVWNWITTTFTVSDVVQGMTTTYQAPPQASANNFAYGFDQASRDPSYVPVPRPYPAQTGQIQGNYTRGSLPSGPSR